MSCILSNNKLPKVFLKKSRTLCNHPQFRERNECLCAVTWSMEGHASSNIKGIKTDSKIVWGNLQKTLSPVTLLHSDFSEFYYSKRCGLVHCAQCSAKSINWRGPECVQKWEVDRSCIALSRTGKNHFILQHPWHQLTVSWFARVVPPCALLGYHTNSILVHSSRKGHCPWFNTSRVWIWG